MSSYSTNLKLELIPNGQQAGQWGDTTNNNLGTLLEQAIAGVINITMPAGNYVLSNLNGVTDEARNSVLVVTGTPGAARTILVPSGQTKTYIVVNNTSGGYAINVQTYASGSGLTAIGAGNIASIPSGASIVVYCTGNNTIGGLAGCYTVAPYTAYTAVPTVIQGYASGTTLTVTSVTSGTLIVGQTLYNPGTYFTYPNTGFPSGIVITAVGPIVGLYQTYTITSMGSSIVGSANYPQTIIALTTPSQIATIDYIQNKMQSPYIQGSPTTDTANAAAFEGQIASTGTTTGILIASKYYIPGGTDINGNSTNAIGLGQFINGSNVIDGIYVSGWGTGATGNSVFTGYIVANLLTIVSVISGTITNAQYLEANGTALAVGTKVTGGGGTSWAVNNAQTLGSVTNPITFNGYGPLTTSAGAINASVNNIGGWVVVQNDDGLNVTNAARTPMISFLSPLQIANMFFTSNISALVGTLGTQSDTAVNILGGTISGVTFGTLASPLPVASGGTGSTSIIPNAAVVGNTSTSLTSVRPGTIGNLLTSTAGASVTAGSFVVGTQYSALTLGTTDFTLIGATSTTVSGYINNLASTPAAGTILTLTTASGVAIGQIISGTGITANTKIVAFGTGTGGAGTYIVNTSQLAGSATSLISITALNPIFTATGVGTGTGTAQTTTWASAAIPNTSIGVNQTWQAVTRTVGTLYVNDTGKPIQLVIQANRNTYSTAGMSVNFNNLITVPVCYNTNSSGGNTAVGSIIIPVGATYVLGVSSEGLSTYSTWELR
jgi:hypothetical protein